MNKPLLITTLTLCLIFLLLSIFTEEHTVITYELKMIEDINDLHRYLSSTSSSDKNGFVHFTKDGIVAYHNDHNDNEAVGEHVERKTLENALNIGEDKILLRQELYDEINEDFLTLCYETCFNDEEYPSPESKADEIASLYRVFKKSMKCASYPLHPKCLDFEGWEKEILKLQQPDMGSPASSSTPVMPSPSSKSKSKSKSKSSSGVGSVSESSESLESLESSESSESVDEDFIDVCLGKCDYLLLAEDAKIPNILEIPAVEEFAFATITSSNMYRTYRGVNNPDRRNSPQFRYILQGTGGEGYNQVEFDEELAEQLDLSGI
ncbi:hypothetical protein TrVE_jg6578 [Triparma verrucosa]|uniref:Uncharacterized protein n=1 Tax=Triparma verrucosa TaxID=1606542 RepID=A0A9W7F247_9STRA|nr:hypothetical protein TrVE_jg6578 [Triparma verrucosa]